MIKDVVGYEGLYEISDKGVVYSKERLVPHPKCGQKKINQKVISQSTENGRKRVTLFKGGVKKRFFVHRLVARSFIGECPDGMEVCHNDGNPANNNFLNLRYDTRKNNHNDTIKHGTRMYGSKNHQSKIREEDVIKIRELCKTMTRQALSDMFGIHRTKIGYIVNRKSWSHV